MHFGLDMIIAAAVIIFVIIGAKKGLFKSLADFIGAFAAMMIAGSMSEPVAEWAYKSFFREAMVEKISTSITGRDRVEAVKTVFESFPDVIQRALESFGVTEGSVIVQLGDGVDSLAESIADAMSPMLIGLVRVLAMVVLFVLLLVIIRAVAALLTGIFELPMLKGINRLMGGVFGLLMAIVVIWVVLACVQAFVPLLSLELQLKVTDLLSDSVVFKMLYDFNPAYSLLG